MQTLSQIIVALVAVVKGFKVSDLTRPAYGVRKGCLTEKKTVQGKREIVTQFLAIPGTQVEARIEFRIPESITFPSGLAYDATLESIAELWTVPQTEQSEADMLKARLAELEARLAQAEAMKHAEHQLASAGLPTNGEVNRGTRRKANAQAS